MKTTKADRTLWALALALLLVALCLMVMVVQTLFHPAAPPSEQLPARSQRPPPAVEALHQPRARESAPAPTIPARAERAAADGKPSTNEVYPLPGTTAPMPEEIVGTRRIGAFAPLSSPVATNYHTAITGKVTLRGPAPPEEVIRASAACRAANNKPLTSRHYVVGSGGSLADVVVFISEGLPGWHQLASYTELELQFTNCQIKPYQSGLPWNEALRIESADGLAHTFAVAPPQGGEVSTRVVPGKPGVLLLTPAPQLFLPCACVTHPWESAFVSTFDHPYYAITDINGRYTLTNVPPGNYVIAACHQQATGTNGILRSVRVQPGQVAHADFVVPVPGTPL